ncbi:MAG: PASTA domain-containing protein [Clostridia bacterium]|nr:PASTA domain-containing protein [Clostridia bacterium]
MSKAKNRKRADDSTAALSRAMRLRTIGFVCVAFICVVFLVTQLFRIQVLEHDEWQEKAVSQQLSDVEVPAGRGQIYDANMSVLAQTREVFTIVMDPSNIRRESTRNMIADEVSVMLEVDRQKLYEQTCDSESQYKVVKSKVDKAVCDEFVQWVDEKGLEMVFYALTDYKREYPLKNLLSCVLGFVGTDNVAREGLELKYDDVLSGVAGRMVITQNEFGDRLPTALQYEYTVEAQDGDSLVLTVDQYIQQVAEKYLQEALTEYKATNRGCAIVMDVKTGAILAMAVKGDYDPNNYLEIGDPTVAEQIAQLSGDEQAAALVKARQEQYRNKALEFYEPGSVFKTVTASIGMEEGLVKESDGFYCGGSYTIADRTMRCWVHPKGHGQQNFVQAIANSCNPAFMTLSQRIGTKLFSKYYTGFGFTQRTGVDLLGEPAVSASLYHPADKIIPVEVAASSIGQTFKVTPLQMVTALSAIANGGDLMQPYIVQKVIDSDGNTISNTEPVVRRQVISADTSARVSAMLENAVSGGAIKNAYISGYRVAGKTGTSQKTETKSEEEEDENVEIIASFGGFAPADDPRVAVLVMVDNPVTLRSGGGVAAPVARKILKDILPYLGVEPNYTEAEISSLDRSTPNVVGKSVTAAASVLKGVTLNYQVVGKGDTVVSQMPIAGATIPKNGTVWLYTDSSETKTATVPDFAGRTVAQVKQAANTAGINVLFSGISASSGTPTASRQSMVAGTKVSKGTVVTVEFTYADNIH